MRRFLLSVLLVIACAGVAASLDHAWLSPAFADDEAAEIKPIEEKPHASFFGFLKR